MKTSPKLIKFYHSKAWKDVRNYVRYERHGICERCGEPGQEVHHIIKLTDENLKDPYVSLNPLNLELLCTKCHNAAREGASDIRVDIEFDESGFVVKKKTPPPKNGRMWL